MFRSKSYVVDALHARGRMRLLLVVLIEMMLFHPYIHVAPCYGLHIAQTFMRESEKATQDKWFNYKTIRIWHLQQELQRHKIQV